MAKSPAMTRNLKLVIEYDGTNYNGWQTQKNGRSIQGELQKAIKTITGEAPVIYGSGRTDSGVHALGQTANLHLKSTIPADGFRKALNSVLPKDISVMQCIEVSCEFHARYSAVGKTYSYRVITGVERPALRRNFCYYIPQKINVAAMKRVSKLFVGEKSFRAFAKERPGEKTYVRKIHSLTIVKRGPEIIFRVRGNGFLHKMVRSIVGTLLDIGLGRISEDQVKKALNTGNRSLAGHTASAKGLFLEKVEYKNELD